MYFLSYLSAEDDDGAYRATAQMHLAALGVEAESAGAGAGGHSYVLITPEKDADGGDGTPTPDSASIGSFASDNEGDRPVEFVSSVSNGYVMLPDGDDDGATAV